MPRGRSPERGCAACGVCCEFFAGTLSAGPSDLERWRREGRLDLLERVGEDGRLWLDPVTGLPAERCPFLVPAGPGRAECGIHATKPALCRDYPTAAHGRRCVRGRVFS